MSVNNNSWNRIRYSLYAPIYDIIRGVFADSREESIKNLVCKPGDKILIVGAGTGLDIPYLPDDVEIVATDITPAMVTKIQRMESDVHRNLKSFVMDGHDLKFPDESFDHVILHLILAVIPDPVKCIKEVERVTKKGGRVAVFDKFIPAHTKPSLFRKLGNGLTTFLFSDITRDIYAILKNTSFQVLSDAKRNVNGIFRIVTLQKD